MDFSKMNNGQLLAEYNKSVYAMNNATKQNKVAIEDRFYALVEEMNNRGMN